MVHYAKDWTLKITMQLEDELHNKIREICADGYSLLDSGQHTKAIRRFFHAWVLIPKPQNQYIEAGWVLTALGDAYFQNTQYLQGQEALTSARHCEGLENNPFILMRLGQCSFELGERKHALRYFNQCIENGGQSLINKEAPKYGQLLDLTSE